MSVLHAFELCREQTIPEINSQARLYRHVKTGAEVLVLANDDENKTFGVNFRTLPTDHTGVAHIVEHVVLGGSEKYPVKEPFLELLKGSMGTYINAMTYPEKTLYPCASQNLQDLYNLMDVYLDAVFHPRLARHSFEQEGWHYELEDLEAPLRYRGIVYNEMKGQYANTDYTALRESLYSIFPDTVYGLHSGGYPAHIPELTYQQFVDFYTTYYHPSNAYFFLYGDLPVEESLRRIDDVIGAFDAAPVSDMVALQPRFAAPRINEATYIASEDGDNKAYVTVQWMLDERGDPGQVLAMDVLTEALIGSPASPLRKALMDSGLGEDLARLPDFRSRQMTFSAGLKGVALQDTAKVEPLILETLQMLAKAGLESATVEAALNTVEFALRENNEYGGQRGIVSMMNALSFWMHGGDPLALLAFDPPLAWLKEQLQRDPHYFARLIQTYLLDNPHRTTVILKPDPQLRQRQDADEQARLDAARNAMSEADLLAIVANTQKLRTIQDAPDSPEALATIPMLTRADLDREMKPIPLEKEEVAGTTVLLHPLDTNGLIYLDLGFDLRMLPQDLLPYIRVWGRALLEMGTETEDFVQLSQRIGRTTGGIEPDTLIAAARKGAPGPVRFFLRGKATAEKGADLLNILRDVLLTVDFDNPARFRQLVSEEKARSESSLVARGHQIVNRRLAAHFNEAVWVDEQINYLDGLFFLRRLAQAVDTNWPSVLEKLNAIRNALLNRTSMLANITLEGTQWPAFQHALASFLAEMPASSPVQAQWQPAVMAPNEGFTIPAQVNYVGKGANLYGSGYTLHGSSLVVNHYLNTTWLWEKIRVQGGAYSGFAAFDRLSGTYNYLSYRDPNLTETLDRYDGAVDFLHRLDLSEEELTRGIVGAIGAIDTYQLPDAKGYTSLRRYLTGETDESLQQLRDEVFSTTPAHFKAFANVLDAVRREGHVVVLGAEDRLRTLNDARGGNWITITRAL